MFTEFISCNMFYNKKISNYFMKNLIQYKSHNTYNEFINKIVKLNEFIIIQKMKFLNFN